MANGAATTEDSVATGPQKMKNRMAVGSSVSTCILYPKALRASQRDGCVPVVGSSVTHNSQELGMLTGPPTDDGYTKCGLHSAEYYSAFKRKDSLAPLPQNELGGHDVKSGKVPLTNSEIAWVVGARRWGRAGVSLEWGLSFRLGRCGEGGARNGSVLNATHRPT